MRKIKHNPGAWNGFVRIVMAALLAVSVLFTAGCGEQPIKLPETFPQVTQDTKPAETVPETEPSQPEQDTAAVASLNGLRQGMVETPQLFAVACFGYHDTIDSDDPVDPFAVMQEYAPGLCADLPFLLNIPEERIIGENGELYCIVPLDEKATVAVTKGTWDENREEYIYETSLYHSESGEPILLFCNNAGWEPDTKVSISGPSGKVEWYPRIDDNLCAMPLRNDDWENLFFDFSPYREMLTADYRNMKDSEWVMPTSEMLIGTTWCWERFLKDGREVSYQVTFQENTLSTRWNDGMGEDDYEFTDARWELAYEDDFAILSIDFEGFAGVRRYNLLYHEVYEQLYVGMDVLLETMPIGWEPLYRFLMPSSAPEPVDMVGSWELAWTEVEGDRNEAASGTQIIEITTNYEGLYWITFTDNEFPDWSYQNKELIVFSDEIYPGCGNDQWSATVNYTGMGGTEYTLTLLEDGMLLMQNYWEMDGAPWVSYGWYRRID